MFELERILLMEEVSLRQVEEGPLVERGRQMQLIFSCCKIHIVLAMSLSSSILTIACFLLLSRFMITLCNFNEALFTETVDWRLNLNGLVFDFSDTISTSWLERLFEVNEVY